MYAKTNVNMIPSTMLSNFSGEKSSRKNLSFIIVGIYVMDRYPSPIKNPKELNIGATISHADGSFVGSTLSS